jgi:hypothetical protein
VVDGGAENGAAMDEESPIDKLAIKPAEKYRKISKAKAVSMLTDSVKRFLGGRICQVEEGRMVRSLSQSSRKHTGGADGSEP